MDFRYELNQKVRLAMSNEEGVIVARSQELSGEPQYRIRYLAGDGRQTECWWAESALEPQ